MRVDNGFRTHGRIGMPQRVEDPASEDDRMAVPSVLGRAHDGRAM